VSSPHVSLSGRRAGHDRRRPHIKQKRTLQGSRALGADPRRDPGLRLGCVDADIATLPQVQWVNRCTSGQCSRVALMIQEVSRAGGCSSVS
jgi:hypothetical protein